MSDFTIEEVNPDHPAFEQAIILMREMVDNPDYTLEHSMTQAKTLFERGGFYTIVGGFIDGKIIGVLAVRDFIDPLCKKTGAELNNFFITPAFRGKKYGEKMLNFVKNTTMPAQNTQWIRLMVHKDNTAIQNYYQRHGYKTVCFGMNAGKQEME